jgi:hypothetical protein
MARDGRVALLDGWNYPCSRRASCRRAKGRGTVGRRRRERSGHTDVHACAKRSHSPKRTIAAAGLFLVMQQLTVRED